MILSKGLTRLGGVVALAALLLSAGLASAPSAHAQAPAILWGPAPAADSVIEASVDGAFCVTAEVDAATLVWAVQIDDGGDCGAAAGSEITFTVDGNAANETVAWSAGLASEVTLTYDMGSMGETPTETPTETPVETPVETPTETMTPEIVVSVTGNAGLVGTSSSSPWLALGLGALAVAMLAGARSVTGRVR